jgi:hypothetical protein
MKASLLALLLAFSTLFSSAQEKPSSKVLMFSGSTMSVGFSGGRNLTTGTDLNNYTSWELGTGVMYGQWKANTLLYYGISFGFSGNSGPLDSKSSSLSVAPTIGLMKKFPISTAIFLIPSAEYRLGFNWLSYTSNGETSPAPVAFATAVTAYPLSLGVNATPKLDVILTVGTLGMGYGYSKSKGNPSLGIPSVSNSNFNSYGQLNSLGVRLLLKI